MALPKKRRGNENMRHDFAMKEIGNRKCSLRKCTILVPRWRQTAGGDQGT